LPPGATASTVTHTGQLLAIALPGLRRNEGYTWRVARRVDARVIREVSEADLGGNVVVLFRVVGRGKATIVFALTRGDSSAKAVRAYRHRVLAR
jgi:hypothetical protein